MLSANPKRAETDDEGIFYFDEAYQAIAIRRRSLKLLPRTSLVHTAIKVHQPVASNPKFLSHKKCQSLSNANKQHEVQTEHDHG